MGWPVDIIERPLTLPAEVLKIGADVYAYSIVDVDLTNGTTSDHVGTLLALAVGYGITDDLEINTVMPTYQIQLSPDGSAKGPLDLGLGYRVAHGAAGGRLKVAVRAVDGLQFGDSTTVRPLRIGAQVEFDVTPKFAVLSHDIGAGNFGVSVGLDGDVKPIFLTLPIGVAYQALPNLWVEADTAIANSIKLKDASNVFISDQTPLDLTGVFTTLDGHLDVLGYVWFGDLQHAGDTWMIGAGIRYYVGRVGA
ncbi:MAG: hypothetical protein QM831_27860 [Kofleriaceae bacterium]